MLAYVTSVMCGFLFALGLGIGGMLDPLKVQNFLDITGTWDPTLLAVMVGALGVTGLLYPIILRGDCPVSEIEFVLPKKKEIERNLIIGPIVFGIGWSLAGLGPGPALCSLIIDGMPIVIFFTAMMSTIILYKYFQ